VLANIQDLDLNPDLVNPWGGLLSRGHPIGASGAVLVCDLFDNLLPGQIGLAMIPAAGGLASGLLVRRLPESP
jgi:acetyl-CoA acetyltransferase